MICELISPSGPATVEQIVKGWRNYDTSQIEYYAICIKNMVGKVITKKGIVSSLKDGRLTKGMSLLSQAWADEAEEHIQFQGLELESRAL
mgnify:FL=1